MEAGRELDCEIAEKVMGWEHVRFEGVYYLGKAPGNEHWQSHVPLYSIDIAAAWEVVERFDNDYEIGFDNGGHYAKLGSKMNGYSWAGQSEGANTAPLAICLAALKAIPS